MQVILRQDVEKLGLRGEIVDVAPGFARNYLLPRRLAETATLRLAIVPEGGELPPEEELEALAAAEAAAEAEAQAQAEAEHAHAEAEIEAVVAEDEAEEEEPAPETSEAPEA